MNNIRFDAINKLYKPRKFTFKNNIIIINTSNKDYVLKKKNEKVYKYHNYLSQRGFNYYLPIYDMNRDGFYVYEYIYEYKIPYEQKANDLIKIVALMHSKTVYQKDVDLQNYDDIYNNISNNIMFLKDYYSNLYDQIFLKRYYTSYENIFMNNYSKINNVLLFCTEELDNWYSLVSNKKSERVSLIHNNLKVEHLLSGEQNYIISFDQAKIDTPILDIVKFYKNEYNNLDFKEIFNTYLYHFGLNDDELKLLFILISIPEYLLFNEDEFNNVKRISDLIIYINKTEDLIRPYYSNNEEEK